MKAFITITGLKFHFGSKPFAVGQVLQRLLRDMSIL